jgi:hypothetical protein
MVPLRATTKEKAREITLRQRSFPFLKWCVGADALAPFWMPARGMQRVFYSADLHFPAALRALGGAFE